MLSGKLLLMSPVLRQGHLCISNSGNFADHETPGTPIPKSFSASCLKEMLPMSFTQGCPQHPRCPCWLSPGSRAAGSAPALPAPLCPRAHGLHSPGSVLHRNQQQAWQGPGRGWHMPWHLPLHSHCPPYVPCCSSGALPPQLHQPPDEWVPLVAAVPRHQTVTWGLHQSVPLPAATSIKPVAPGSWILVFIMQLISTFV